MDLENHRKTIDRITRKKDIEKKLKKKKLYEIFDIKKKLNKLKNKSY